MTSILIKFAAVLAILAVLFFGEQYIEGRGYDRAKAEDQAAQEKKEREEAELRDSDQRQQRLFNDKASTKHLETVDQLNNQLGAAREKIAHLSGRQCLDSSTVGVLNAIGASGQPGGTAASQPAVASEAVAADQDVAEFIAICRTRYGAVSDQLNQILDIEDRRHPPPR